MELFAFGVVLLLVAGGWLIYRAAAATREARRNASARTSSLRSRRMSYDCSTPSCATLRRFD
jgi:hypothetical protein